VLERPVDERRSESCSARALQIEPVGRDQHDFAGLPPEQSRAGQVHVGRGFVDARHLGGLPLAEQSVQRGTVEFVEVGPRTLSGVYLRGDGPQPLAPGRPRSL
jgi:hypothetical protein